MPIGFVTTQNAELRSALVKAQSAIDTPIAHFNTLLYKNEIGQVSLGKYREYISTTLSKLRAIRKDLDVFFPLKNSLDPKLLFIAKRILTAVVLIYDNIKRKTPFIIDNDTRKDFGVFFEKMHQVVRLLNGRSIESLRAPYEVRYIKLREKMYDVLVGVESIVNSTEYHFAKLSSSDINDRLKSINGKDKLIIPLLVDLSDLAAATPPELADTRRDILQEIQKAKETKSNLRQRLTHLYNRKLQEERNAYKESLRIGKSGEFNRNTGFSERGRFGGLDIDSRPRLDRAIKRYIDRQVRAYIRRMIKSR